MPKHPLKDSASNTLVCGDHARPLETGETHEALIGLAPAQRRALELAYFDGLTDREIADLLELPRATVRELLRQGLASLAPSGPRVAGGR